MSQPRSDHIKADGLPSAGVRRRQPATDAPVGGLQLGDAPFDVAAAAEKMKCDPNQDAVCTAIEFLIENNNKLQNKVAFFEKLFGFPTEYLMAFHQDELKKFDNIRFMGQQKLEGEALRQALIEKTGKEVSPEVVKDKFIIETVREAHYEFAVVLHKQSKEQLDRMIQQVREADAKAEEEAKAAKASMKPEAREAQDVVMTEDDPPEKDDPSVSQKTSSEHYVGPVQRRKRPTVFSDGEEGM